MPVILILSQKCNNESVQMLESELKKCTDFQVISWEINEILTAEVKGDRLFLVRKTQMQYVTKPESIALNELVLVIKRTWGEIREEVLKICKILESYQIKVLNGARFIEWCHSKAKQYESLRNLHVFPQSIIVNEDSVNTCLRSKSYSSLISDINSAIGFPFILKINSSCRGQGVFRIESPDGLQTYIEKTFGATDESATYSLIFQKYISSNADPNLSTFYRVNMIDGIAVSALLFQYRWTAKDGFPGVSKLENLLEADDRPVSISYFPASKLLNILKACPCQDGIIGIDIILNGDEMFLLEFNSGPTISEIVRIGQKYLSSDNTAEKEAAENCARFAEQIASSCHRKANHSRSCDLDPRPNNKL